MSQSPAERAHATNQRTGLLLLNLGTPDAPTPRAIRRYLRQFLSSPRVIELPRPLWLPILYGFILPLRPRRVAHAYRQIWTEAGSPLLVISRKQAQGLRSRLQQRFDDEILIELAMICGQPDIDTALAALEAKGVRRLLVLPLFPQYSGTTTGSALSTVLARINQYRWLPELRTVNSYHDDPAYIDALARSVKRHWQEHGRAEHLLISFHGIPRRYVEAGDPYYCHCHKTARLVSETLQLQDNQWSLCFQSRFGKAPWVQPYTDQRIADLAAAGTKAIEVLCPGFAADCLETLEEIDLRYRALFLESGGERFHYIPALNAGEAHLDALTGIAVRHLQQWVQPALSEAALMQRQQRAQAREKPFYGR